jgi:multidrug resistance efflux pump
MAGYVVFREDLAVTEKHENGDHYYLVSDPRNDEIYEFGEQEWFLLQLMDGKSGYEELIESLSRKYHTELSEEQLVSFISMVAEWGLVYLNDAGAVSDNGHVVPAGSHVTAYLHDDFIESSYEDITDIIAADKPFQSRPVRQKKNAPEQSEVMWVLFNPNELLLGLYGILAPLRWLRYVIPVLVIIAGVIIFNNLQIFIYDFLRFRSPLSIIQVLVFSMFTVNLISQLGRGAVARGAGVAVEEFGIKLALGIIPRFAVNISNLENLDRRKKLGIHSSALLIRFVIFAIATMFWLMSRTTGTLLPIICLMLLVVAAFSIILTANPLYNSDGYKLLTTLLEIPNLRQKANLALFNKKNNPLAERVLQGDNLFALRAYALSSVIFVFILLGAVLIFSARWFELNYQGTGVVIYLLLTSYLVWRLYSRFVTKRAEMKNKRSKIEASIAARSRVDRDAGNGQRAGRADREAGKEGRMGRKSRWLRFRYILLILLIIVSLLPYPYESGGVLNVLPNKQYDIYAETPGVIKEVLAKSGEHIQAGTLVAILSSVEQENDLLITQASMLEQQAKLEQLQNTPRKEEIAVAEGRLGTARTQYKYSSESAKRLEPMYKEGNVSLEDYQDEKKQMDVDRMQIDEMKANLDMVVAGPHPKEIEAAEYELRRLKEKLEFDEVEVSRTRLLMPIDGHLVTANLDLMMGHYLDVGDHFATAESDESVRVEIQIPESDIADVSIGASSRLKVWAYTDRLFHGEVSEIAPSAIEETYGKIVNVTVVISNQDHLLKSGMTGFGKVDGGNKPVIVAFTRMLVRFFTIELWSWIP